MAVPIFVRTPQPKVHPRPTTGRLETVSGNSSGTFTYGYETNSGLIKTVTRPGLLETQPALRVTNTWDPARDVLLTKANELASGETVTDVSSITYTVNPIGQRTHATRTGAATNGTEWGYDTLGQLETADDTNPAADRAYQYDSIGNRKKTATASLTLPEEDNWSANPLNQLTKANGEDLPADSYDDDGNQLKAKILPVGASGPASCVYHWDAENRLTSVTSQDGEVLVSYLYDAQSRLISRSVGVSPTTATAYIHDGWNRIAEYTVTPGNPNATPPTEAVAALSKTYLWGLDLSGTFQGAGGVGGLLSVNNIGGSVHYPTFDGNGNITEYLTAAGVVAAHFEYDPFGNTVTSTDATNQFEYRFSTKPIDSATGLFYYGHRWYDPLTGRWPSRDPIEEDGGVNLYGFVGNDGVDLADVFGLKSCEELVDSTVRHSLLEVAKDLRSVRKLTTEEALDEAQYVADFEVIKNNIKKLCCCSETFRQLLDWFSSIHAPNEEPERKVITVFTQAQQERRSGEGTRGDSAGGIVTVVPDAKLPLTVAHEITHVTRGETDLPLPLAKKLKDAERDIEDADGDYRSEYQARMMERIIANESVTKCNYYIESYPYYGLKKIPDLPPALKLDPTKPGGTNPDMRRDPKSKRLVTEVDEISRTHPYVKVRL